MRIIVDEWDGRLKMYYLWMSDVLMNESLKRKTEC